MAAFGENPTVSAQPTVVTAGGLHTPAFPHAARASSTALKLSWSKEPGAAGYVIYRASGDSKPFAKVKTINSADTTSWINKRLKTDKKYTYKLRSFGGVQRRRGRNF